MCFAPLDLSYPLERQLPFHAALHKASDELEYGPGGQPRFGPRIQALRAFLEGHPAVAAVDPLDATAKVAGGGGVLACVFVCVNMCVRA